MFPLPKNPKQMSSETKKAKIGKFVYACTQQIH